MPMKLLTPPFIPIRTSHKVMNCDDMTARLSRHLLLLSIEGVDVRHISDGKVELIYLDVMHFVL